MEYNIGDRIVDENRDFTIIDKKYFCQHNRKSWYYRYRCNKCGYDCSGGYRNGEFIEANWFSNQNIGTLKTQCPCCMNRIIVTEINSIHVTHPELSKYFLNDDDKKYSIFSNNRTDLICPFCGNIKKNMVISSLYRQGLACPVCSDKVSIGERIVYYILKQSNLNFKKEFMFDNNKWRYDFYIQKYNAIIEVHGEQHYKQTTFGKLSVNQQNDIDKKNFALNNGIEKYIEINAMKSDYDYIVNSILNSDFYKIYDLSFVDWNKIREKLFNNSIVKDICIYWEHNKYVTYVDMERIFSFSESTIRKYLKIGYELGWCNKDDRNNKLPLNCNHNCNHNDSIPVLCTMNNTYFKSAGLCSKLSEDVIGKKIATSTIRYKIKRNKDFKYITKKDFNDAYNNGMKCYGNPFGDEFLNNEYYQTI